MSLFFGDHEGCETMWLDDRADIVACPSCGSPAYTRRRAVHGPLRPLHVHEIVACVPCGRWQVVCGAPLPSPDLVSP